jgi:hypothetical protein
MKRLPLLGLICVLLLACGSPPVAPEEGATTQPSLRASSFTDPNDFFPQSFSIFVPCAAGGLGEDVLLTGRLHQVFHVTVSNTDNVVRTVHNNARLSGIGATTGDLYHSTVTDKFQTLFHFFHREGQVFTEVFTIRMIGQGSGTNFVIRQLIHVTVNANGSVSAVVDKLSIACK